MGWYFIGVHDFTYLLVPLPNAWQQHNMAKLIPSSKNGSVTANWMFVGLKANSVASIHSCVAYVCWMSKKAYGKMGSYSFWRHRHQPSKRSTSFYEPCVLIGLFYTTWYPLLHNWSDCCCSFFRVNGFDWIAPSRMLPWGIGGNIGNGGKGNMSETLDLLMADAAVTVDRINVAGGNVLLSLYCAIPGAICRWKPSQ